MRLNSYVCVRIEHARSRDAQGKGDMGYDRYEGKTDRPKVTTTGGNKREYFIGGKRFTGAWKKEKLHGNAVYDVANGGKGRAQPRQDLHSDIENGRQVEILA